MQLTMLYLKEKLTSSINTFFFGVKEAASIHEKRKSQKEKQNT